MFSDKASQTIKTELKNAEQARQAGNEGRARVCARRAAGAAVREYLRLAQQAQPNTSAYGLLGAVLEVEEIPTRARTAAGHLLSRVDEDHNLEAGVDLLQEARTLANELENISILRSGGI